jgi:presenilin-like A22 family membrane protease
MKPNDAASPSLALGAIIVALIGWGALLAIGALFFGGNANKAIMIFGCVGTFVGVWVLLLITRKRPKPF